MKTKAWWESKTILTNIIIGVLTALELRLELLQPLLSANIFSFVSLLLVIINVALRSITTKRVTVNKVDDDLI